MQKIFIRFLLSLLLLAAWCSVLHAQTLEFSYPAPGGWLIDKGQGGKAMYFCMQPRCTDGSVVSWIVMDASPAGRPNGRFKGLPAALSEGGSGSLFTKRAMIFTPTATAILSSSSTSAAAARSNFDTFADAITVR